jgi:hypothetical protein
MFDAPLWFRFLIAILATWRVTHLLSSEDGPGDIIIRIRRRLGKSTWGQAMDCFYCLSLWTAAPVALIVCTEVSEFVPAWLAISGGACLLDRVARGPVIMQ